MKSEDSFTLHGKIAFSFVRDADPWSPVDYSKLPKRGSVVEIDGNNHTVSDVQVMRGMGTFSKHFVVVTDTDAPGHNEELDGDDCP